MEKDRFIDFVEVKKGEDGYHYVGKSNNGEILFTSESFSEKAAAIDAAGEVADQSGVSVEVKGE